MAIALQILFFSGGKPTFAEFCDFIAENSKDEWGEICVVKSCRLILQDNPDQVEYSYGKLKNKPKEEYADRRIKEGTCWYSWNNYDYYVVLEREDPKPKPQTNADRIRAMSDEELAGWLERIRLCCATDLCGRSCPLAEVCYSNAEAPKETLDWLREGVSE